MIMIDYEKKGGFFCWFFVVIIILTFRDDERGFLSLSTLSAAQTESASADDSPQPTCLRTADEAEYLRIFNPDPCYTIG